MSSPEAAAVVDANDVSLRAGAIAKDIENHLASGESGFLTPTAIQSLMVALCRAYAAECENGTPFPIMSEQGALTGTDVMVACSALLKAANLQVFELGMWTSWTGR